MLLKFETHLSVTYNAILIVVYYTAHHTRVMKVIWSGVRRLYWV